MLTIQPYPHIITLVRAGIMGYDSLSTWSIYLLLWLLLCVNICSYIFYFHLSLRTITHNITSSLCFSYTSEGFTFTFLVIFTACFHSHLNHASHKSSSLGSCALGFFCYRGKHRCNGRQRRFGLRSSIHQSCGWRYYNLQVLS